MSNSCMIVRNVLSNLGSRIWTVVPDKLRQLVHIYTLKKKLKSGTHAGYVKLT